MQGQLETEAGMHPQRKVQWVSAQDMANLGLSSGVKKVWKLVLGKGALSETGRQATGQKMWKQQKLK